MHHGDWAPMKAIIIIITIIFSKKKSLHRNKKRKNISLRTNREHFIEKITIGGRL